MEGPTMLRQRAGQKQRLSSKTWRKVSVKGLRKKESRRQKEQQGQGGEGASTGERMPWKARTAHLLDGHLGLEPHSFHFLEAETQPLLSLLRIKTDVPGTATIVTIVFLWIQRTDRRAKPDGQGGNGGPQLLQDNPGEDLHNP